MITPLHRVLPGLALAALVTAGFAAPAGAQAGYDGVWSVLVITEKGTCDRGYRYPVRIRHGKVGHANPENTSFNISGRVSGGGGVFVKISRGDQSASGSGRMSHSSGSGRWKTATGQCSGVWTAERRG
jgi:hypothetical protein